MIDASQNILENIVREWEFEADSISIWLAPDVISHYIHSVNERPAMSMDEENSKEALPEYEKICQDSGIAQYTKLSLDKDLLEDDETWTLQQHESVIDVQMTQTMMIHDTPQQFVSYPQLKEAQIPESIRRQYESGSRIFSCVSLNASHHQEKRKSSFDIFREEYLDSLLEARYNMIYIQIMRGCYKGVPVADIPIDAFTLTSTVGSNPTLTLANPRHDRKMTDWFLGLLEKYK
jgi:hypothetical protein